MRRLRANPARRLVPVHLGHHDVHQDDVDIRVLVQLGQRLQAVLRVRDLHLVLFQDRRDREQVPRIVVDQQHLLPGQRRVGFGQTPQHLPLRIGQVRLDAMEEQRRLVQQALGRTHVLHDDRLGEHAQLYLLVAGQLLARVDDDRHPPERGLIPQRLHQLDPRHSGQT